MKKRIYIGIPPTVHTDPEENPFLNRYEYVKTYIAQILKNGAIPICLNYDQNHMIKEQVELCDAFLLPGGSRIEPGVFELLEYAYQKKLPVLGICLGMQELAIFSCLKEQESWNLDTIKQVQKTILTKIPDHNKISGQEKDLEKALHTIFIEPTSKLFTYYEHQKVEVLSFHNYAVNHICKMFQVTSFSYDGILESIESRDPKWLAIGVQFHPELEKQSKVIEGFIKNIKE